MFEPEPGRLHGKCPYSLVGMQGTHYGDREAESGIRNIPCLGSNEQSATRVLTVLLGCREPIMGTERQSQVKEALGSNEQSALSMEREAMEKNTFQVMR